MRGHGYPGVACIVLLALLALCTVPEEAVAWTTPAAAAAAQANPQLVTAVSKEIGGTREEAAGAAGALFGLAKSRLKADEFSQVAKAVPGLDAFLKAAPSPSAAAPAGPTGACHSSRRQSAAFRRSRRSSRRWGFKPELVPKVASALVSFVTKLGRRRCRKHACGRAEVTRSFGSTP